MTTFLIISILFNLYFIYRNYRPDDWLVVKREKGTFTRTVENVPIQKGTYYVELHYSESRNRYKIRSTQVLNNLRDTIPYDKIMQLKIKLEQNGKTN